MTMKRLVSILAPLALAACSGSGTLHLDLNSDDSQPTTAPLPGDSQPLWNPNAGVDLTTVKSIVVTVNEVDVHLAADNAPDPAKGEDVPDNDGGWHVVTNKPQQFDLMTIRADATKPLGDIELPTGKVTQVRLKLAVDGTAGAGAPGEDVIKGAVTEADGTTVCDLLVPHSAVDPGVKIAGKVITGKIDAGGKHTAVVNIKLSDSADASSGSTCAFRLNPVIKIKKYDGKP